MATMEVEAAPFEVALGARVLVYGKYAGVRSERSERRRWQAGGFFTVANHTNRVADR